PCVSAFLLPLGAPRSGLHADSSCTEPLSRSWARSWASCRFGLLSEHHHLVAWLNARTLFDARSKRCSSITYIIELFSAARLIRSLGLSCLGVFWRTVLRTGPTGIWSYFNWKSPT